MMMTTTIKKKKKKRRKKKKKQITIVSWNLNRVDNNKYEKIPFQYNAHQLIVVGFENQRERKMSILFRI